VLTAALITGGLLSFGAAFLSDIFDPTVRNAAELGEALHVPILAEFGPKIYLERGEL
jgi:capsular polysaccharide biosynthesis protein